VSASHGVEVRAAGRLRPGTARQRERRLRRLRKSLEAVYPTTLQRLSFGDLDVELLRVADVDALLDRLPTMPFRPDDRLPYWADLWPSALALAGFLWRTVELQGQRVLELGCGLGLVGIVASLKGAAVTLTDYEADALAFARYNVVHNQCLQAEVRHLDWHAPRLTDTYPWIIASDILYERRHFRPLWQLLERHLAPQGRFIVAEPNRPVARDFFRLLRDHGLRYARRSEAVEIDGQRHDISIYIVERRPAAPCGPPTLDSVATRPRCSRQEG
jgi:predicted nicotinamide N-methyase